MTNPSRRPKPAAKGKPAPSIPNPHRLSPPYSIQHSTQHSVLSIPGFSLHPSRPREDFNRPYGWRPEPRHVAAQAFEPEKFKVAPPKVLPAHVSLQADCPPVYDQGKLGSCTANAIAAAIQVDLKRTRQKQIMPSRLGVVTVCWSSGV